MESILSELGAVNENESDVKRNVLRDRILKAVRFPKPNGDDVGTLEPIKVIGGAPELSKISQRSILLELKNELREAGAPQGCSYLYEMAVIKLRIFQSLVGILDDTPDTSNEIITSGKKMSAQEVYRIPPSNSNGRKEVQFLSLSQIGKDPGHKISSSSRYSRNGGFIGGGSNLGLYDVNLHVHGKSRPIQKWNIDDSAIDNINDEAKNRNILSSAISSSSSCSTDRFTVDTQTRNDQVRGDTACSSEVKAFDDRLTKTEGSSSSSSSSSSRSSSSSSSSSTKYPDSTDADSDRGTERRKGELCEIKLEVSTIKEEPRKRLKAKSKVEDDYYQPDSKIRPKLKRARGGEVALPKEVITCPICNNDLPVGSLSAAVVLDRHIDRCTRRFDAASIKSTDARVQGSVEKVSDEGEDWMDCGSDENSSPVRSMVKLERGKHGNITTESICKSRSTRRRSPYVEIDSNSESDEESNFEDPQDDFKPDGETDSGLDDSEEMDSEEDEFESNKIKVVKKKVYDKGISKKGKGKGRCAVVSVLAEPGLSAKDKRKADKLMQERHINKKGLIEEDKVEVLDDWEDDFYLDRLDAAGISDFNDIESHDRDIRLDKEDNRQRLLTESGVKNESYGEVIGSCPAIIIDKADRERKNLVEGTRIRRHKGYIISGDLTEIDRHTWEVLFEYQKDGIKWLYSLYESGVGGILGDEMGLGKTAQLCCHFGSLSRKQRKVRNKNGIFLVVCPATVLQHWLKEFHRWVPAMRCVIMHTISKTGAELQQLAESGKNSENSIITIYQSLPLQYHLNFIYRLI